MAMEGFPPRDINSPEKMEARRVLKASFDSMRKVLATLETGAEKAINESTHSNPRSVESTTTNFSEQLKGIEQELNQALSELRDSFGN